MTSIKLFNKRAVNHLLNSGLVKEDLICQACFLSICRWNHSNGGPSTFLDGSNRTTTLNSNTISKLIHDHQASRGFSTMPSAREDSLWNPSKCRPRNNQQSLITRKKFTRSHSSTSTITGTSLKRDASTQAQQLEADQLPNFGQYYETSFRSSELEIIKCAPDELRPKPNVDMLKFGHAFTDHMFRVDWDHEDGWSAPLISKLHNLDIHPAAKVLHYALEAFEGAKAFRGHDNKIRFFRLDQNIKRLQHSAKRLSLPGFDQFELQKCIHKLVELDQDWIPVLQGQQQLTSLYVRPTILGVEPSLGVASSKKAILYVLLSPVGPYFKTGFKPISLFADPNFVRAWPGGAGNTKLGSNYAPTIMVQREAEKRGHQQVLWLYGEDMKLTEVGTMNIFVTIKNARTGKLHLVTPPLTDGLILPGITRASILELSRQWDDVVCEERYVTLGEIEQLIQDNNIVEMFGAGTACIVCPISTIHLKDGKVLRIPFSDFTRVPDMNLSIDTSEAPSLTRRILKAITDIQYGKVPHRWAEEL